MTRISKRLWFSIIFFGLIGQIAWVVENMNFATFCQDIFSNSGRPDLSYIVTTLMVILSAVTATATTIWAGARCDRAGKRKPFIAYGYMAWGVTIMLFALLPMRTSGSGVVLVGALLVVFDCVMTFAGSTANDAAFNAWITDNTDTTTRGKVDAILSMLPVFAVVVVFIVLGPLYDSKKESNSLFFLILGLIPLLSGILALVVLKDAPSIVRTSEQMDTFYGFRKDVVASNRKMFSCLAAFCIVGISQQTFFSYLINFLVKTLGFGDGFVVPMAIIIVGSAVFTGVCGAFLDKKGRKHFYLPLLALVVLGTLSFWLLQFVNGVGRSVILYLGGIVMMGSILSLTGALLAAFQDYIPKGYEGRFQGVRMCFTVLIPMIVGPIISMLIGLDAMGMNGADFAPTYSIFLAAAIVALAGFFPLIRVRADADRLRDSLIQKKSE